MAHSKDVPMNLVEFAESPCIDVRVSIGGYQCILATKSEHFVSRAALL
jgi:hypothetical protein